MNRGLMRRLGERMRPWRRRRRGPGARERKLAKEIAAEFSTEELLEFLEGDLFPTQADPVFKEKLRQDLWLLVQRRYGHLEPPVED